MGVWGALVLAVLPAADAQQRDWGWVNTLQERAAAQTVPGWLREPPIEDARARALDLLEAVSGAPAPPPPPAAGPAPPQRRITVFLSRSLPDAELRALFRSLSGRDGVEAVFRGVRPGETLGAAIRSMSALIGGIDPPPAVSIDPERFRALGVASVPELVLEERGEVIARVRGLSDPDWLLERMEAGDRGDLGVYGPTVDIVEADLIEELMRRAAALDWSALRQRALARYWRQARFVELPEADADRVRRIDPTLEVTADVLAPDGRVIASRGQRLNPLDVLPFHQRLVVFDATRPAQVEAARREGGKPGVLQVVYVATRLDRTQGWEGLDGLEATVDAPVFLLTPDLARRFSLERVPAVVEAAGDRFMVREVKP